MFYFGIVFFFCKCNQLCDNSSNRKILHMDRIFLVSVHHKEDIHIFLSLFQFYDFL